MIIYFKNKLAIGVAISAFTCLILCSPVYATQVTITYTYDNLNRLTAASYSSGMSMSYVYDPAGNITKIGGNMIGDANGDGIFTLADAIAVMQVMSNITPAQNVSTQSDIGGDGKIGLPEAIYIIQKVAGLR